MTSVYDLAVVGAGIVGAATAREFQLRNPGSSVVLLEKGPKAAGQQTSHNSGVIHAGVYYKPGSLKARLCTDGRRRMLDFCAEHDVPVRISGKLIVALNDVELARLQTLKERAEANGIDTLQQLDRHGLRAIEPHAGGIAALHLPGAAVTDYDIVTQAMVRDITSVDGEFRADFDVRAIESGDVTTLVAANGDRVQARRVVVCTGTQVDRTQRLVDDDVDFAVLPFRGAYYALRPEAAGRVRSMIYPVPDPRFPFLGVHLTRHVDDSVSCGPNAVLSPGREGQNRWSFSVADLRDALRFRGTWKLARRYWKECAAEVYRDLSKRRFVAAAQHYLPALTPADLTEYHFGIRAQAVRPDGSLIEDFDFAQRGNVLFVRNAPSPAATASLAIASHILDQLT